MRAACSFDVVKDSLGGPRSKFPHTAFFIAGTQAAARQPNSIEVMKLSDLSQGDHGKKVRPIAHPTRTREAAPLPPPPPPPSHAGEHTAPSAPQLCNNTHTNMHACMHKRADAHCSPRNA